MAKLWGLFRPPLPHRRVLEKYMAETPWGCEQFRKETMRHGGLMSISFELNQSTIAKQNPSFNTWGTAQGPVGRFPTTPKIFRLGCLDLFRSKASSIISRASRCSTCSRCPHRGGKIREAVFVENMIFNANNPPTWWKAQERTIIVGRMLDVIHHWKKKGLISQRSNLLIDL